MTRRFRLSRRGFLKFGVTAGVTVWVAPLSSRAFAALFDEKILTPIAWNGIDGSVRFRIDGMAKVTGEKVFARDVRATDLPHWPQVQSHGFFLRCAQADKIYQGFDLSLLGDDLKPDRIVTADDLARDGLKFPAFYGDDMLLPVGKTPAYLGHAVALLIYHDFPRYAFAKEKLKFRNEVIRYGATTGPLERDPWGSFRFVRVGGKTPFDDDEFSSLKNSPIFPSYKKHVPIWPVAKMTENVGEQSMVYAEQMAAELAKPPPDWLVLKREYFSQSIDTAALEPDNANGWYDGEDQALHLVLATQSPQEVAEEAAGMVARGRIPVKKIFIHPCYTVGYGSKDHCNIPYYGLIAALYGDGKPVRIAYDRYEQFQTSLKRHSFRMNYQMAIDKNTGLFQSFTGAMVANGGGRCNFSPSVAMVGATAAQSIYYFPKTDLASTAVASRAIDAGSARGYGTLQSMSATEMMVDEFAEQLGLDPIDLRLKNVLKSGMKNTQGAIPGGAIRADEVLAKAKVHPLWRDRARSKLAYEAAHPGKRYGVGFGCVQKDFGTGAETSFARVELAADGHITLHHTGTDMGTGTATSQAVVCARWLGKPADEVRMAITDWSDLPVVTSGDPYLMSQAEQDRLSSNPRWSPNYVSPSSASNSAYFFSHTTRETARVIFEHGIWPAALAIWGQGIGGGQMAAIVVRREDARWVDGKLTANGMEPLPLAVIAQKLHEMGFVTGAIGHAFNRWQWAEADFNIGGETLRRPLDGLAVRDGKAIARNSQPPVAPIYRTLDRRNVFFPPTQRNNAGVTYYSAVGTLVELAVDTATGKVDLLSHHSIMECGNMIVPQLVSGQLQGGIAMGIGHALHEYLPLYEDGPGNGTWNFNRYHLPMAADVAVWKQTGEVLAPLSETDPPKGIAEVVMIPVVPAIVNGIAHAIGHRFRELPVTPEKVLAVLK